MIYKARAVPRVQIVECRRWTQMECGHVHGEVRPPFFPAHISNLCTDSQAERLV